MNTEYKLESGRFQPNQSAACNKEHPGFQQQHLTIYNNNSNDLNTNMDGGFNNMKAPHNGATGDSLINNLQFNDLQLTANSYQQISPIPDENQDAAQSQICYPQPPILETDWKNKFLTKSIKSSSKEKEPKSIEQELPFRKSNRKLLMSHYNPGICIYRPPSSEKTEPSGESKHQDSWDENSKNSDTKPFTKAGSTGDVTETKSAKIDKNNNNHKNGKVLKKSSNLSDVSYKMFYNKYNLKMKGSTTDIYDQKQAELSTQLNNNSIPPGGSILTMAKNMVKKYQPPVTPDKPISDFYSFFKNNGSNMFVSLSNQDLLDDTYSTNYEDHNYEEFSNLDYKDDDSIKMKLSDDASSLKKFQPHVEKGTLISDNVSSNPKKSRIYVNTNLPIKRVYNAGSAANYLKERFHNRNLKVSESREGYDQTVHKVMKNLYDSWLDQNQCDVAIVTDDGEIMSHQALLSSFSGALARQFKANKPYHDNEHCADAPQQIAVIDMSRFSKETITDLLHFLYTTDIRLTDGNVTKFLLVAKKLELDVVTKKCEEYLLGEGQNDDLLLHYFIANTCDIGRVKTELQAKVAKHFNKICVKNNITKLSRSLLVGIFEHTELNAKEENKLLAVSKWIEHNKVERMKCVSELMTYVSFESIPIDYLTDLVEDLEWMFTSSCMRNKLLEAYKFHTTKESTDKTAKSSVEVQLSKDSGDPSTEKCDNNNAYNSSNIANSSDKLNPIQLSEEAADKISEKGEAVKSPMKVVETVEKESSIEYKSFPEKTIKKEPEKSIVVNKCIVEVNNKIVETEKKSIKESVKQPISSISVVEKKEATSKPPVIPQTNKQAINNSVATHETAKQNSIKSILTEERMNQMSSRSILTEENKNQASSKSLITEVECLKRIESKMDKCSNYKHSDPPKYKSPRSRTPNPNLHQVEYHYNPSNKPSYEHTDYNFSNSQNLKDQHNCKHSQSRSLHKERFQNHVGTSMTPAPMEMAKKRDLSTVNTTWKGATQGVVSIFESTYQPPPIKQYQLQNNLATLKFIEIDPN